MREDERYNSVIHRVKLSASARNLTGYNYTVVAGHQVIRSMCHSTGPSHYIIINAKFLSDTS